MIFDDSMIYGTISVDNNNEKNTVHETKKIKGILKNCQKIEINDIEKQNTDNKTE